MEISWCFNLYLNEYRWDFPGGPVVKNMPRNARSVGSVPGRGTKVTHALRQLSLQDATTEPMCTTRECVRHKATSHMTVKIQRATTEAPQSQTNTH